MNCSACQCGCMIPSREWAFELGADGRLRGPEFSQDGGQRNGAILFVQAQNGINKYVGVNSGTVLNEGDSKDLA